MYLRIDRRVNAILQMNRRANNTLKRALISRLARHGDAMLGTPCLLLRCILPSYYFNHITTINRTTFGASEMDSAISVTRKSTRVTKKTLKVRENDDCIPIPVQPLPETVESVMQDLLSEFEPVFRVDYKPTTLTTTIRDSLCLFLLFFSEFYLSTIVKAINIYTSF